MADLLLELFSEEIPARMQAQAAKDLERLVVGALSDRGLLFEGAKAFAGPRRLTLAIAGLPAKQPDVSEELKGPKVDAPQAALDGFLRKTGLAKDQLKVEKTPKGDVYLAVIARKGRDTAEVLAEVLPETFAKLPWPKSMRFPGSSVRWVRPLHAIVATFDGEIVPFEFAGVTSGNVTYGHRFLSSGPITVRRFDDYVDALRKAHVILDADQRKAHIFEGVKQAAFVHGLEMIPDEGLLDEVAGLAEYPQVLIGAIEDQFMDVPPEILQTSMRTHQKYFSLRDPKTGKMANRFALVAATVASDAGREIVAGNERVLRARLSDAKFFWDQDRKRTLESRVEDLKGIVFHAKLGTQYERVQRIDRLSGQIAAGIDKSLAKSTVGKARRAATLAKADLTTGVVGEFPELQGVMGRYYALASNEDGEVADAVRDHYKPMGPRDVVPTTLTSIAVALADKLNTLVGFFEINERPTGSSDPFALRRAALGVVRIIVENNLRLPLPTLFQMARRAQGKSASDAARLDYTIVGLADFFEERFKVMLRERGAAFDLVDAVFSQDAGDLVLSLKRLEALQSFLASEDGTNLLAAYKRAANIVKAEEKKYQTSYDGTPDPGIFAAPEEKILFDNLAIASDTIRAEVERERFVEAMGVMARLRAPVDAFFDKVTVNDKDATLRENRLKLLSRLRATLHQVADFSKIEG
jgi:glycyl-tRNA synthetase beta chain